MHIKMLDYKKLIEQSMLDMIKGILTGIAKDGLPGNHHFYITFDMSIDGVETSIALKEKYPDEMTIVIQNWYEGLVVKDSHFCITLNFGNIREAMQIPFSAIKSFVDPSVEFGLSFEIQLNDQNELDSQTKSQDPLDQDSVKTEGNSLAANKKSGEVVNIESFRKS